jgi:hypothetical protein
VRTSSTSSSERRQRGFPWAALVALLGLLVADRLVFGALGPWQALAQRISPMERPHHQVARSRDHLRRIAADAKRPSVVVMGSSRADVGFRRAVAEARAPEIAWAKLCYPALRPFEMRSLVGDVIASRAQAAVLVLSEFETQRPLRLDPMPGTGIASLAALGEMVARQGVAFTVENRTAFYRIVTSTLLQGYRFREVIRAAAPQWMRVFAFPEGRFVEEPPPLPVDPLLAAPVRTLDPEARQKVLDGFPPARHRIVRFQLFMLSELGPGPQVELQEELIRSAVRRLRAADVRVFIVEAPLHPDAGLFYDTSTREGFLRLVDELERDHAVEFVPVERFGALQREDFGDLLHLGLDSARSFTARIVDEVEASLGPAGGPQ